MLRSPGGRPSLVLYSCSQSRSVAKWHWHGPDTVQIKHADWSHVAEPTPDVIAAEVCSPAVSKCVPAAGA